MKQFVLPHLYGIIGTPIGHTLSPALHNLAFKAHGIHAMLFPWQLAAEDLSSFVTMMDALNIKGCCVTIPHKQAIIPLLGNLTRQAKVVGAVNMIYKKNNTLIGDNTDVAGFVAPLLNTPHLLTFKKALVLGTGGGARAVLIGLQKLGLHDITVVGRCCEMTNQLAKEFMIKTLPWHKREKSDANFIINATPIGMAGKFESETPYNGEWLSGRHGLLYDIVYNPVTTRLCREAKAAGWEVISGINMFFAQANSQFHTWTGLTIPDEAKEAVLTYLTQQNNRSSLSNESANTGAFGSRV